VNTLLWIIQCLLALVFTLVGLMMLTTPKERIIQRAPWAEHIAPGTIKLIGILELFGAIGLIVPMVTGILPWLTPLAAVGLALTMVGALITHLRHHEYPNLLFPFILLLLALFVACGRFVLIPA
jgi:hypothetical protein